MSAQAGQELSAISEKPAQIVDVLKRNEGDFTISSTQIDLEFGDKIVFEAKIRKLPLLIQHDKWMHQAMMDTNSPDLENIKAEAQAFKALPENERPRRLLQLVRSRVDYPYSWVIEKLLEEDEFKYLWVTETLNNGSAKISECVKNGLAKCDQFAILLLFLGNEAGLQGTIATYSPTRKPEDNMVNIDHPETKQQLFKSVGPGEKVHAGHAWVEFLMTDGSWLPVDPATQLVGDNPENLAAFQHANYQAFLSASFLDSGLPPNLRFDFSDIRMKCAQASCTGRINITPITMVEVDKTETQHSYHGPLNCSLITRPEIVFNDLPIMLEELSQN